jgi:hypothetical protein
LLPLLLDVVTPTWLTKVLNHHHRQQQQQQEQVQQEQHLVQEACLPAGQRLVRLSPDAARAVSLQLQQATHASAASRQSSGALPVDAAAAAVAPEARLDKWGSSLSSSGGCGGSSFKEQQQVPVLIVPRGYAATSAGGNMPVLLQEAQADCQQQQQQQVLMPASLLTDQLWSVGQHPR